MKTFPLTLSSIKVIFDVLNDCSCHSFNCELWEDGLVSTMLARLKSLYSTLGLRSDVRARTAPRVMV